MENVRIHRHCKFDEIQTNPGWLDIKHLLKILVNLIIWGTKNWLTEYSIHPSIFLFPLCRDKKSFKLNRIFYCLDSQQGSWQCNAALLRNTDKNKMLHMSEEISPASTFHQISEKNSANLISNDKSYLQTRI